MLQQRKQRARMRASASGYGAAAMSVLQTVCEGQAGVWYGSQSDWQCRIESARVLNAWPQLSSRERLSGHGPPLDDRVNACLVSRRKRGVTVSWDQACGGRRRCSEPMAIAVLAMRRPDIATRSRASIKKIMSA